MAATRRRPPPPKPKNPGGLETLRPHSSAYATIWDVSRIRSALAAHDSGDFASSGLLMHALMRDPRILGAVTQRVGAALGLPLEVQAASRAWEGKPLAESIREEAFALLDDASPCLPPSTQAWMLRTARCFLGVAICRIAEWTSTDDRWTPVVEPWPAEHTRWDDLRGVWTARTRTGTVDVVPGSGEWIVYEPDGYRSWLSGPIRALGMPWADRTYATRDRSRRSESVGLATFVGTLPDGVRTNSQDAQGFKSLLQGLQQGRGGMVKPHGYELETLAVDSDGHDIFDSMIRSANEDVALAILGQTGTSTTQSGLGQGGNRVHDGVRYDLLEADVRTLYSCITAQLVRPWVERNWGRTELTPRPVRVVPDLEEAEAIAMRQGRYAAFVQAVLGLRSIGVEPDVVRLAREFSVDLTV